MQARFYVRSLFLYRCQRTFRGEALSAKPFGGAPSRPRADLIEVRSRALNLRSCFQPLCGIERLIFGVSELTDERRLLRNSQPASQGSFEVHRREPVAQTASAAIVLCLVSGPGGATAVPPPSGKKITQPSQVPSGCGSP